jgi:hypothetical protein
LALFTFSFYDKLYAINIKMQTTEPMLHQIFIECYQFYYWVLSKIATTNILEWSEPSLIKLDLGHYSNYKCYKEQEEL